ncbi:hypothetical protein M0805_008521 [Coniferiporia weirii]|nr:hypothetical protein M0805_008521 [Coniferiporia weirii]
MDSRPAWQTDDLADEWIEADEDQDDAEPPTEQRQEAGTVQFTSQGTYNFGTTNFAAVGGQGLAQHHQVGTFVVREDLPAPVLPKTPGNSKGSGMKDIFSPLQLEKMFEPPSPPKAATLNKPNAPSLARQRLSSRPAVPSKLSQVIGASFSEEESAQEQEQDQVSRDEIVETDLPDIGAFGNLRPSPNCHFTFSVPRMGATPGAATRLATADFSDYNPQAQSTPIPPHVQQQTNPNDSRLRLFQFQYDTYTRDHLSALVDSFGVSSPSNGSTSKDSVGTVLLKTPEEKIDDDSFSRLRAAKRLKLTPPMELVDGSRHVLQHPAEPERPMYKKDYVGESRSLMQQIKRARDISMASVANAAEPNPSSPAPPMNVTNAHPQNPSTQLNHPASSTIPSLSSTVNSNNGRYSSLAFRQKAEELMAKIKSDRRLLSEKTDKSFTSQKSEEDSIETQERSMAPSPETRPKSPLKRRLDEKENVSDPDPDPDPPSYAASIARSGFVISPRKSRRRPNADFDERERPKSQINGVGQSLVVMPIVVPDMHPAVRVRSPNPAFLAPPTAAPSSIRFSGLARTESTNEDLNRLVSSGSTATTATTLTAGSGGLGVKQAGPAQMVRIAPADLPTLPDRVGGMVFDHKLRRWVKERETSERTPARPAARTHSGGTDGSSESDDPFRDIESLRDDDSGRSRPVQNATELIPHESERDHSGGTEDMRVVDSDSDSDSEFDAQLSSFTFDNPATGIVQVMTGEVDDGAEMDELTDSELDDEHDDVRENTDIVVDEAGESFSNNFASMSIQGEDLPPHPAIPEVAGEPTEVWQGDVNFSDFPMAAATPCPAEKRPARPPRSALKSASVTPISRPGHRRSVSFSDGRKDGKILGLDASQDDSQEDSQEDSRDDSRGDTGAANCSVGILPSGFLTAAPSLRSKRIADMLEDLEESILEDEPPPKGNQNGRPYDQLRPSTPEVDSPNSSVVSRRSLTRSPTIRPPGHSSPRRTSTAGSTPGRTNANATFLTECSFGVAHDRLVEVITDVQPFEPYWDSLASVDLSGRELDSVARLKEFLPRLDSLNLNNNILSWLSGIPGTVRTLSISSNILTSLTSFGHLLNLENLDISHNDIDSLQQLGCLRHLREFRADGNKIANLDGLAHLDGLLKLSLQGNELRSLDFSTFRWSRLELLNLSDNRLESVRGLGALPALVSINIDNNSLSSLDQTPEDIGRTDSSAAVVLQKLRILRLSGNRLKHLDVAHFPNLRTLYVDNNCLVEGKGTQRSQKKTCQRLLNMHRLGKLENLSARNQSGPGVRDSGLHLQSEDIRDVKRLYLSGNPTPLPLGSTAQACYNLVYLELAACRLTTFPQNFSALMPNIRALNLNYNFLETDEIARGLAGLTRLRKLTIVGNRMTGTKALIKMLSAMGQNVEMLDFRMNPCTLGWYLPLLVHDKDDNALLQPSEPPKGRHHSAFSSTHPSVQTSDSDVRGGNVAASGSDLKEARQRGIGSAPSSPTAGTGRMLESGSQKVSASKAHLTKGKEQGPSHSHWEALDAQFRRGLPDKLYAGRLAYRGLVMRACPQIKILDGVRITEKERRKAEALLRRVLKEAETANETIRADDRR